MVGLTRLDDGCVELVNIALVVLDALALMMAGYELRSVEFLLILDVALVVLHTLPLVVPGNKLRSSNLIVGHVALVVLDPLSLVVPGDQLGSIQFLLLVVLNITLVVLDALPLVMPGLDLSNTIRCWEGYDRESESKSRALRGRLVPARRNVECA